ncbi:MAG: hypothetical protein IT168_01525 [Bryobacterales bacterium]|nr:hypothetical protein [Bryobacterales bacterium]
MQSVVAAEVDYGDLVWIIQIQSTLDPVRQFAMPAAPAQRSTSGSASMRLQQTKNALLEQLRGMRQVPGNTDISSAFGAAFDILRSHPAALRRFVVAGSDYITDTARDRVSLQPPASLPSAAGVDLVLLVCYPRAVWLQLLGFSHSEFLDSIESRWPVFLRTHGARNVAVRLVDSVRAPTLDGAQIPAN